MIPFMPRVWIPVLAGAAIIAAVWVGERMAYKRGYAEGVEKTKAEYIERALKQAQKAWQSEEALRTKITETQKESSREKALIARQRDAALASLRNRPERPASDVPTDSSNGVACTGASLFRADAEFLVREAARADQLRIDLQACQAAYDSAREMTKAEQ